MKKILTLFLVVSAGVCFAEKCTYCPATMGVRIVNGRPYCGKHYCSKHKEIHSEDKCYRCDLQSRLSRGKAKCAFCNNTKKLTIAKGNRKYEAFCPDHYCSLHKCAFYEPYSGTPCCLKCKQDASRQYHSEPLTGLFGVELNASIDTVASATLIDSDGYKFTPDKPFRNFKNYMILTTKGKINTIVAVQTFNGEDEAESEYESVLAILDKKYGRDRRTGILKKGYYEWHTAYNFACDEKNENPQQRIIISKTRSSVGKYDISVSAFLVSDAKKMFEADMQNDIDAL